MSITLKDVEELKGLGEAYLFDPKKRYVIVIKENLPARDMEAVAKKFGQLDIPVFIMAGVKDIRFFEMERTE